jgi:glycosyltransferase involved in cell wall biosynthesis
MTNITHKQLKILIVHNYYKIPGGEDTVVYNERKLLEIHNHEVIFYCRHNTELDTISWIGKVLLPLYTIFSFQTYREVKKIIHTYGIDIVHVHNTMNLISPSVYYAALSCKVPVIQTLHNFRLICPAAKFYREGKVCEECINMGLKSAIKHKCYRDNKIQTIACVLTLKIHRLLGIYKKIYYICLSEFNKKKLMELNRGKKIVIDPNKVFIKSNFIATEIKYIPYSKRKNQFIYVGRIDSSKGIEMLLETWKNIDFAELNICGIGPQESYCKEYIESNKMSNVHMMGYINNENIRELLAVSKALIMPTQWYEGLPMTIIESFSCGTPVIGSDIGNVGNMIVNGINGVKFQFDSCDSLLNAVKNLQDLCYTTYEYYKIHYTANRNYNKLVDIYQKVKLNEG